MKEKKETKRRAGNPYRPTKQKPVLALLSVVFKKKRRGRHSADDIQIENMRNLHGDNTV